MCGIAGIIGKGNLNKMVEMLAHRGPDDKGFFRTNTHPLVQLGVTRLAITDRKNASQPFKTSSSDLIMVFNGEIYNFKELKKELKKENIEFTTCSDTEVLLKAYEKWGHRCLSKLNGMFAFAIWDKRKKILFLARDRLGIKPLYYSHSKEKFIFASEIKAMLHEVKTFPSFSSDFFSLQTTVLNKTLFHNIFTLLPGHFLIFDGRTIHCESYWSISVTASIQKNKKKKLEEAAEELRFLIQDSVRIRTDTKEPLGVFLSGGLDSSILACMAKPKKVFTCNYPFGEAYDEYRYARLIADETGADLISVSPDASCFQRKLPEIVYYLDQPIATASSFSEFMLAETAKSKGVKIVLGGQGADEIFGGYMRYLLMQLSLPLNRANPPFLKNYFPLIRYLNSCKSSSLMFRYFYLLRYDKSRKSLSHFKPFFNPDIPLINQLGSADIALSLPSLLTMNDRAAAAFGMENRTPFLDHRLVEYAFNLPPELKINGCITKYVLRKAAEGIIPETIIKRYDKKGLVTPVHRWLNGPLKNWASGLVNKLKKRNFPCNINNNRGEFDRSLYHHVFLELWFQTFFQEYKYETDR